MCDGKLTAVPPLAVRYFLKNKVSPDLCNEDGLTALHQVRPAWDPCSPPTQGPLALNFRPREGRGATGGPSERWCRRWERQLQMQPQGLVCTVLWPEPLFPASSPPSTVSLTDDTARPHPPGHSIHPGNRAYHGGHVICPWPHTIREPLQGCAQGPLSCRAWGCPQSSSLAPCIWPVPHAVTRGKLIPNPTAPLCVLALYDAFP